MTGAHFEMKDMCRRIEVMAKQRTIEFGRDPTTKVLNKELRNQHAINVHFLKQKQEAKQNYSN